MNCQNKRKKKRISVKQRNHCTLHHSKIVKEISSSYGLLFIVLFNIKIWKWIFKYSFHNQPNKIELLPRIKDNKEKLT